MRTHSTLDHAMLRLSCDPACSWVSFAIFKPRPPYTARHLIERLTPLSLAFHATGFVSTAILRSLDQHSDTVAVYSIWDKGWLVSDVVDDQAPPYRHKRVPKAHCFEKAIPARMAETVDAGWYEASCCYCKSEEGAPCVAVGDVAHVGFVTRVEEAAGEGEESLLAYSCLATLKSYTKEVEGLHSYSFYSCLHAPADDDDDADAAAAAAPAAPSCCGDRRKQTTRKKILGNTPRRRRRKAVMAGVGVWRDVQSALAFLSKPGGNPAERVWQSLDATSKFDIYQVAHVASD